MMNDNDHVAVAILRGLYNAFADRGLRGSRAMLADIDKVVQLVMQF